MANVTAVFDIGKTNKKFFLLDQNLNEVRREYIRFDEIPDDDGFLSEDLSSLTQWTKETLNQALQGTEYKITHVNFSTYGASMVHLDDNNEVVAPFYNYLKPIPEGFEKLFIEKHGDKEAFELNTASPFIGLLNSGLQLFYLKYFKPEIFDKIKRTVHFPQYLSSIFTKNYNTDFTSLGCHTGLWNFNQKRYADWVIEEGFDKLLCPIESSSGTIIKNNIQYGIGIHDSSSALLPYSFATNKPFVLISTGTWSICMNPFNHSHLTNNELDADCLHFLDPDGNSVKASRLFLGSHLRDTAQRLSKYFDVEYESYKKLKWSKHYRTQRSNKSSLLFDHSVLRPERFHFENGRDDFSIFSTYQEAFLSFYDELTDIQIASLSLAIGDTQIENIFIDGGFSSSEVFVKFLAKKLPDYNLHSSSFSLGTSVGAALIINKDIQTKDFLDRIFSLDSVGK